LFYDNHGSHAHVQQTSPAVHAHAMHTKAVHAHALRSMFYSPSEITPTCQLLLYSQNQFNSGMQTQMLKHHYCSKDGISVKINSGMPTFNNNSQFCPTMLLYKFVHITR
jgi:hypothetical protein